MLHSARFFIGVGLISLTQICAADTTQIFSPAVFQADNHFFEENIVWPELDTKEQLTVMLFCNYLVSKKGQIRSSGCRPNDRSEKRFTRAIEKALRKSKLSPALVDGVPVNVLLFGRILIQCDGAKCEAMKIPNLGYHYESLGVDYIAPQMINTGLWIYDRISDQLSSRDFPNGSMVIMFTAKVNPQGDQSELRLTAPPGRRLGRLEQVSLQKLRAMSFIPGFHNGEAVSMDWYGWVSKGLLDD